jgi:hypothetical protein
MRASWLHGPAPVFGPAWRYLVIVVGAPHSSALTQEAQSVLGGMKPYTALAAITSFLDALALYVLKKCLLYRSVDVPEAVIPLRRASRPSWAGEGAAFGPPFLLVAIPLRFIN